MNKPQLDFRDMTADDLRHGISTLNRLVKQMKDIQRDAGRRFDIAFTTSTLSTALVALAFPPAGLIMATTSALVTIDPTVRAIIARQTLDNAVELRKKLKTVWRARPGRAFHDVAARAAREKERRKSTRKFRFPGFGRD